MYGTTTSSNVNQDHSLLRFPKLKSENPRVKVVLIENSRSGHCNLGGLVSWRYGKVRMNPWRSRCTYSEFFYCRARLAEIGSLLRVMAMVIPLILTKWNWKACRTGENG